MIRKKTNNMNNKVKGLILKRKLKIKKYKMNNIKSKNMSKIKIQKFKQNNKLVQKEKKLIYQKLKKINSHILKIIIKKLIKI